MVLFQMIAGMNGFVREVRFGFAFVHFCAKKPRWLLGWVVR
jgi:hypothetical protein